MNKHSIYLTSGFALLGFITSYAIARHHVNLKAYNHEVDLINNSGGAIPSSVTTGSFPNTDPPFNFGDTSQKIATMQQALNRKYGSALTINGKFDAPTAQVLCKNYFTTCVFDWQSTHYTVDANDYAKIIS